MTKEQVRLMTKRKRKMIFLLFFSLQLDVARQFVSHQTKEFGFEKANVDFRLGKIESLVDECQLETNLFDVVM